MKTLGTMMIAAGIALSLAAPAVAKEKDPVFVTSRPVKDKPGPVAVEPTKALMLMRSDIAMPLYLMKVPTPEDQAAYDKMRAAAFVKAQARYVRRRKEYDLAVEFNAKLSKGSPRQPLPDKPVEPTEANFEFTPFPLLAGVAIGPTNRFAKGEGGASTYLHELTPGEYRIYGPVAAAANGAMGGQCFCMGSVAFVARAGEVVDIGLVEVRANAPGKRPDGDSSAPMPENGQFLVPAPAGMALDSRLAGVKVVPARFRPVGKLPNYFGLVIGRMPAMAGVMRYERDRIVDLTGSR